MFTTNSTRTTYGGARIGAKVFTYFTKELMGTNDTPSREEMIARIEEVILWTIAYEIYIGDVLQWMRNVGLNTKISEQSVCLLRDNLRKPIDEQSDECVKYIYSLLETTKPI